MYVHAQFLWMLAYLTPGHAYLTHLAVGHTLSNANGLRALLPVNVCIHKNYTPASCLFIQICQTTSNT